MTTMKDDTISRAAALDALDKVAEMFPYRIPGKAKTYRQYNEAWSDAIDAAENALEVLPPVQPGWIPTSVKPPEPFKLVLIQDYCGCYELNTYIPPRINPKQYPNGYWGEVGTVDFNYFDVEAWCPLPAPYRPEGDDKHEG